MRYGGIYLYILCSFKRNVVIRLLTERCPSSLSLVYIAALLQARVTTYTPNLPLMLYYYVFLSYI